MFPSLLLKRTNSLTLNAWSAQKGFVEKLFNGTSKSFYQDLYGTLPVLRGRDVKS